MRSVVQVLVVCVWTTLASPQQQQRGEGRRPDLCLFDRSRPEEALYDQYALALAATERARELRDAAIREAVGPWRWAYMKRMKRTNVCDFRRVEPGPRWRSACARHAAVSSKIIEAVSGLSVADFNRLTRRVAASPKLKEKVAHQAYLYRVASKIDVTRDPVVLRGYYHDDDDNDKEESTAAKKSSRPPSLSSSSSSSSPKGGQQQRHTRGGDDDPLADDSSRDAMRLFASLAMRVEALRQRQRAELIASLNIDDFPAQYPLCDASVLPFMSDEVRSVCRGFPKKAADLVESHGVPFASFERLLDKADHNPVFRWRLHRTVRQLEKENSHHKRRLYDDLLSDDDPFQQQQQHNDAKDDDAAFLCPLPTTRPPPPPLSSSSSKSSSSKYY